jgi:hypothetical protein
MISSIDMVSISNLTTGNHERQMSQPEDGPCLTRWDQSVDAEQCVACGRFNPPEECPLSEAEGGVR